MLTPRLRLIIASLLLGPWLIYWGLGTAPTERQQLPPAELEKGQDFFATDIQMRTFNTEGSLSEQLETPRLDHYPHKQESIALTPRITVARDHASPITAHANIARFPDLQNRAVLAGDARVQDNASTGVKSELRSEMLVFYPDSQTVKTNKPVTIVTEGMRYDAVGLEASLKTRTYHLLDNVKGVHQHEN